MNWVNFHMYNDAPTKAFEILCNQLFENWCKEQYKSELVSFHVVNGAGGDGGVESYAVLSDGNIIGLQAKWFPDSITTNQIGQIKNSINTALKIRPQIIRYIICVPRDLASLTGKGNNTEDKRWEDMKSGMLKDYPDLIIDLWDETRLTHELQKDCSAGIFKFWFERAEISEESVQFSFEKSKNSWLSTKYVPELNTFGTIHDFVRTHLGDVEQHGKWNELFSNLNEICNDFFDTSDELIDVCGEIEPQLVTLLNETKSKIQIMQYEAQKIQSWLEAESVYGIVFDEYAFWVDSSAIAEQLKNSKEAHSHYFLFSSVTEVLRLLDQIRLQPILDQIKRATNRKSIIFLGEPGTGKTHGIAAEAERLLKEGYHVPILIRARDISESETWRNILISNLGLSDSWSEEEIWQGLSSLANRKRIHVLDDCINVSVLPKILIIVDGIDESSLHEQWIERIQKTSAIIQKYPLIRFCFLSRPYVFKGKNTGGKIVNIDANGDVPTYKLFDKYVKAYNIDVCGAGWVKYALTTPLALKLFCELNRGKKINYYSGADVSIAALIKEKIRMIEDEYCKQDSNATVADQNIFRAILALSAWFSYKPRIERNIITGAIAQELSIDIVRAQRLTSYLENYGILRLYCEHGSGLISPDVYFYYPGIQGYFDYASALMLLDKYKSPQNIDFNKYRELPRNAFYILAIISIQKFAYLIAGNKSIDSAIDDRFKEELRFFALRHTNPSDAGQYKPHLLRLMANGAEILKTITNEIVLPLVRGPQHPLGVPLLNEFLIGFEHSAQRDVLWSVPSHLKESEGEVWYSSSEVALSRAAYSLTDVDKADGLPTVYAWALSTVDNVRRQAYRTELMKWAHQSPDEFYKLFLKFSSVNDPQIRSDVFSILMSLLFEDENIELLHAAAKWIMNNILAPNRIESNRDIAIRYYSTSIVRKAVSRNVVGLGMALNYLPPFTPTTNDIALSKDALVGTYMGGYGGISYDLGRYVLIDHIVCAFPNYNGKAEKQYKKLIDNIAENRPEFTGISSNQLILSAAYAFILSCGWNEEFRYHEIDGKNIRGVDRAIAESYWPKTHGSQSPVMTICEKYVWQARNYISGFLADRLMYVDDDGAFYADDYSLLDNFLIPALEIEPINPGNIIDLYPWHIPEQDAVIIPSKSNSADDVKRAVQASPNVVWEKWVQLNNAERQYPMDEDKLIALCGFSCFESPLGMKTNLYISSILVAENDFDSFIKAITQNPNVSYEVANPTDWKGVACTHCYITPKEVCWMPWKKRYDSPLIKEFPKMKIHSAVDECTYKSLEYGEVSCNLPSTPIREMLEITNTDGYKFYSKDKHVKAAYVSAGENWRTQQNQLLVSQSLLNKVQEDDMVLVWIMREQRRESGKAREKFGDFYAEKDNSYVGSFSDDKFVVYQIPLKEDRKVDAEDIYKKILDSCEY